MIGQDKEVAVIQNTAIIIIKRMLKYFVGQKKRKKNNKKQIVIKTLSSYTFFSRCLEFLFLF
jgi:hypothetical protein